ncbi:MAG: hypothetical protein WBP41_17305 [Saprospiraceae bacterium]
MKHRILFSFLLKQFFVALVLVVSCSKLSAQVSPSFAQGTSGFQWKDKSAIEQIVQQELDKTSAALTVPDLTDWTLATLEAYRSFLIFTQAEMQVTHEMSEALDKAYDDMKTENVQNPESRAMVLDDMKAIQTELVQKLTYQ